MFIHAQSQPRLFDPPQRPRRLLTMRLSSSPVPAFPRKSTPSPLLNLFLRYHFHQRVGTTSANPTNAYQIPMSNPIPNVPIAQGTGGPRVACSCRRLADGLHRVCFDASIGGRGHPPRMLCYQSPEARRETFCVSHVNVYRVRTYGPSVTAPFLWPLGFRNQVRLLLRSTSASRPPRPYGTSLGSPFSRYCARCAAKLSGCWLGSRHAVRDSV